ncbi:MATE family efflux transporter [Ructibacterium gallinarum]|uniref:MATE family efflux transporter n=1 Tax=Ructibacterium gallinarum TaxID=2779355 RepID=A0A9D5M0X5_9FIRM|nr:MATE family efflux transporter [Ructibacterium gallinarum]MBE5039413.1 MATE family efflux transporter [Ructibacterium gallinarum]
MTAENTLPKENKMGTMPINKLLISMSVPMIISMLVQALYNIVDSMFVAQISENALTAVSLAFPAQNLMIAVATGTGVGVNALLSKSLGEKNFHRVNLVAGNALFLTLCSYIVFALLGVFFSRLFFSLQTDITEIIDYGVEYLVICTVFSFGIFGQVSFEKLLQSTGKTIYTMCTQGLGAIINLIFDPIFIFGLLGFPKMGVAGAAAATVLGQIIACILGAILNHTKNHEIQFSLHNMLPKARIIKGIYAVGLPSIIMASISSIMTFGMNKILIAFTSTATAVFGVYFKLQSFVFMPVFGLNNGMVPIVAYNFGAKKPDRITKTVKLSIIYAFLMMLIGFIIFQLFTEWLLMIFNASEHMLSIGIPALRIISISFLLAGYSVICASLFQALGHGLLSLCISVLRQLVVLLPLAFLLSKTGILNRVWLAFPAAELVSFAICVYFHRYSYRKEIIPMQKDTTILHNQNDIQKV